MYEEQTHIYQPPFTEQQDSSSSIFTPNTGSSHATCASTALKSLHRTLTRLHTCSTAAVRVPRTRRQVSDSSAKLFGKTETKTKKLSMNCHIHVCSMISDSCV